MVLVDLRGAKIFAEAREGSKEDDMLGLRLETRVVGMVVSST